MARKHRIAVARLLGAGILLALLGCGGGRVADPAVLNSQPPDKVLYDKAIEDLEKGRYQTARLKFQTLMSTYPDSEYLEKARLAIADSWQQQGIQPSSKR